MVFPAVVYGCETWTIKKTEYQRTDCGVGRRLLSPFCNNIKLVDPKGNQPYWSWNSNTLATWCQELTHWKRPWYWGRLKAGREGVTDGMSSLTQWTWVWASSRRWGRIGKAGVLQSKGLQRVRPTERLNKCFDKLLLGRRETPSLGSWLAPKIDKKKSYIQ